MGKVEKKEDIVNEIKSRSKKRPQRMVIDEVLPGGVYRILSAEMKPTAKESQMIDMAAWGDEKEHYMNLKQLSKLLSKSQSSNIREGQVFRIKQKRAKNIHDEVRKGVKEKTKNILVREGKTPDEVKGRRR